MVSYLTIVIGLPFVIQYWRLGVTWMSVAVAATIVGGLLNVGLLRRHLRPRLAGAIGTSLLLALLVFSNLASGGFYDPNFGWLYVIPILGAFMASARAGWIFTGIVFAITLVFWQVEIPSLIPEAMHAEQSLANRLSAVVGIGVVLAAIASQRRFDEGRLRSEITRREELQSRLVHSERLNSMGSLAAGVAHEINNPLTYVLGNVEMARSELEQVAGTAFLQRMLSEAIDGTLRVRQLVRDLNTFARRQPRGIERIDVHALVRRAAKMAGNEIRPRAELVFELEEIPDVWGDESRLFQIVLNLLTNAAHAIPEGAADQHRITLRTLADNDEVWLEVADTGKGIPQEQLGKIFEPFFTTKPVGRGTGLGLSICNSIVESMQGRIEVESTVGTGTTVRVILPQPADTPQPRARGERANMPNVRPVIRSLRVLVIDDEDAIRTMLRTALPEHQVVEAKDGAQAIEVLQSERFDVVLCDLVMPRQTGADVHRFLQHAECETEFVLMTGGDFTDAARQFLAAYNGPQLEKPMTISTIRDAVEKASDAILLVG